MEDSTNRGFWSYYWLLAKHFGRVLWEDAKRDLVTSFLLSVATALGSWVFNLSDAWVTFKVGIFALFVWYAIVALFHLARSPWRLHHDRNGAIKLAIETSTYFGVFAVIILVGICGFIALIGTVAYERSAISLAISFPTPQINIHEPAAQSIQPLTSRPKHTPPEPKHDAAVSTGTTTPSAATPTVPVAKLHFVDDGEIPSIDENYPFARKIVVMTNTTVQPIDIGIVCDAPVGRLSVGWVDGGWIRELKTGTAKESDRLALIEFKDPPFKADRPLIITIMSKTALKVLDAGFIPPPHNEPPQ